MGKRLLLMLTLVAGTALAGAAFADAPLLQWEDLRPENEPAQLPPINPHDLLAFGDDTVPSSMADWTQDVRPVVPELDGKTIQLGGFIVPLDGDEERITEFLLVPYPGACIHVPPPPTNQLLYVKYDEGLRMDAFDNVITDAVKVTGTITTARFDEEDFAAGYSLTAIKARRYH